MTRKATAMAILSQVQDDACIVSGRDAFAIRRIVRTAIGWLKGELDPLIEIRTVFFDMDKDAKAKAKAAPVDQQADPPGWRPVEKL